MKDKESLYRVMLIVMFIKQIDLILNKIAPPKYEEISWWLILSPILIIILAFIVSIILLIILIWKSNKTYEKITNSIE